MNLEHYTSKYTPLHPLLNGKVLTETEALQWLVHEARLAGKQMIRFHLKEDIIRFVILAQTMELHGYSMVWVKHKGCVGATRKGTGTPTSTYTPKTLER